MFNVLHGATREYSNDLFKSKLLVHNVCQNSFANFTIKQCLSVRVVTFVLLSPGSLVTSHKAGIEIKSNNTFAEAVLY